MGTKVDDAGKDVALRRDEGFVIGPNHGNAGGNQRSGRAFGLMTATSPASMPGREPMKLLPFGQ